MRDATLLGRILRAGELQAVFQPVFDVAGPARQGHYLEGLIRGPRGTSVEAVIPSHYHDDHLAGLPWLQQTQGTQAWIFENFAEMVANPAGYNVPCLLPHRIRVDRTLADRGSASWDRWRFDVFHMPGHTWWALGLFGEIDGTRVAFTGDNLLAGTVSPLRAAAPVYRNKMLVDSIAVGVRRWSRLRLQWAALDRPGSSPARAIAIRTYGEIDAHLSSRWCATCGGYLERGGEGTREADGRRFRVVRLRCQECERVEQVFFDTTDVLH